MIKSDLFYRTLVRPDYSAGTYQTIPPVIRFVASKLSYRTGSEIISNDLISYEFSESVNSIESDFSLVLVPALDRYGLSWLDKIKKRDLVFIYEFGELRYGGYVKSCRYKAQMSGEGKPNRIIAVSGGSLGKLLTEFNLTIKQTLYNGIPTAETASVQLSADLAMINEKETPISDVMRIIYEDFFDLVMKIGGSISTIGVKTVLDRYIDFETGLSDMLRPVYPMNLSLYQVGENNIWQILSQLVFPPVNEMFGRWNPESKKYQVIFRKTPFDASDWKDLPLHSINPLILLDHEVGSSDEDVFTFYCAELPGSGISTDLAFLSANPTGANFVVDEELWGQYGYRQLLVTYKYLSKEGFSGAAKFIRNTSEMLKGWYRHNNEFLSGRVTIMTPDGKNVMERNPKAGERLEFLEGEFYIEGVTHSWTYEQAMRTDLTITRGFQYNPDGSYRAPIEGLGRKLNEMYSPRNVSDMRLTMRR